MRDPRLEMLSLYNFTVGVRDSRFHTKYEGCRMVVENFEECELPCEDGDRDTGGWGLVGDDLDELIQRALEYLLGLADDGNTIEADWRRLSEGHIVQKKRRWRVYLWAVANMNSSVEVEADTQEEAEALALEHWHNGNSDDIIWRYEGIVDPSEINGDPVTVSSSREVT